MGLPLWVDSAAPKTPCTVLETWNGGYTFGLVIDYSVDDRSRSTTFDDDGEPVRLVGPVTADHVLRIPYADPSSFALTREPRRAPRSLHKGRNNRSAPALPQSRRHSHAGSASGTEQL